IPAPMTCAREQPADSSASSTHATIAATMATPPSLAGVVLFARPRIWCLPLTTPTRIFVPPRSIPSTGRSLFRDVMVTGSESRQDEPIFASELDVADTILGDRVIRPPEDACLRCKPS